MKEEAERDKAKDDAQESAGDKTEVAKKMETESDRKMG